MKAPKYEFCNKFVTSQVNQRKKQGFEYILADESLALATSMNKTTFDALTTNQTQEWDNKTDNSNSSDSNLRVKIKDIDQNGLVKIVFSQPLEVPENLTSKDFPISHFIYAFINIYSDGVQQRSFNLELE